MVCPDCSYYQRRVKWVKIFLLVHLFAGIYLILNVSTFRNKVCNIDFDHDYTFKRDPLVWQYYKSRKIVCDALTMVTSTRDMLVHMLFNFNDAIKYRYTEYGMYSTSEYLRDVLKKINRE